MSASFRIGVDENGLGARLGPMVVTAVLAEVDVKGARLLGRRLPQRIADLIGDSKQRVSHDDVALGEAWARALVDADAPSPDAVFSRLSLEGGELLQAPCPSHVRDQCWTDRGESFGATPELVARAVRVRSALKQRGVDVQSVKSSVICTERLNTALAAGRNRFVADLHAMETLVLSHRARARADVVAICGKVGGMADYTRFFGPLGGRLHVVLDQRREHSAYRFPGLGELHFVRDADASDPLVMLASLVGKWVRELLMARVARWYDGAGTPSGYHDPVTARFVDATALARKKRRVPDTCFERVRAKDE